MRVNMTGWRWVLLLAILSLHTHEVPAQQSSVDRWSRLLAPRYFPDQNIVEDKTIIDLVTPYRAEDAAVTPVRIKAMIPQTAEHYIETLYLFADANPEPLVGKFTFTPGVGRADLALRVRIDRYTNVRAVAVLNNGEHHMVSNFVKAQGGCAAPMAIEYSKAMAHLGELQLRTVGVSHDAEDEIVTQLMVRHPNITGMQMDYKIYAVRPPHYVKQIRILLNGKPVMTAETGISVSEDPSFRFYIRPQGAGQLSAEVTDSKGQSWHETIVLNSSS